VGAKSHTELEDIMKFTRRLDFFKHMAEVSFFCKVSLVCAFVWLKVGGCIHIYIHICIYTRIHIHKQAYVYLCIHICVYIYIYIHKYIYISIHISGRHHIYIYIYIYTHISERHHEVHAPTRLSQIHVSSKILKNQLTRLD